MNSICGIYQIKNIINQKLYIGSSVNIKIRWNHHKNDLRSNRHHNKNLQRSYNKYGESAFEYSILEQCSKEMLLEREQYYIDQYNVCDRKYGYNIAPIAGRTEYYGADIDKLKQGKYTISYDQFQQITYMLQTSDISIKEISEIIEINIDTVYSIYNHKNYKNLTKNMKFIKRRIDCQYNGHTKITEDQVKEIISLLLDGKTIYEVSQITNVHRSTVSDIKHHHSWKNMTKDIEFPKTKAIHPSRRKSVKQISKDGVLVNVYKSVSDALKTLGTTSNTGLIECLKGKRQYYRDYIWEYA